MKEDDGVETKLKTDEPKKSYTKPTLTVFGEINEMTLSSCDPNNPYNNPYMNCS